MMFSFRRRTVQGLFRLVLIKDYGATRSGGAAKLRQVEQTAPKARDMKELRDKIAKQSAKGAKYDSQGQARAKRARRPWILSKKGVEP